jgi:hypothetical protein
VLAVGDPHDAAGGQPCRLGWQRQRHGRDYGGRDHGIAYSWPASVHALYGYALTLHMARPSRGPPIHQALCAAACRGAVFPTPAEPIDDNGTGFGNDIDDGGSVR